MNTTFLRRLVHSTLAGMLLAGCVPALAQEGYPDKPIRLVVPYPPGGFTDILGRMIAEKLSANVGQPIVVDNRGGGGSTIGTSYVAKSAPDGYTLLLVALEIAVNETLVPKMLTYHADKDLTPVIQTAWSPMVLVMNSSVPAKNLSELIALAKAHPGTLNFGSGGNGTGGHLALEMFKRRAGIDVLHVPYRGNGPALSDLLGGQVSGMFLQYAVAAPQVAAGKLRILATPSGKRSPAIPDVPTIAESGLPGFDVQPWFGIMVPADTPSPIVRKINAEIAKVMNLPDVKKRLADLGAEAVSSTPEQFGALIASETTRWAEVIKTAHIKVE